MCDDAQGFLRGSKKEYTPATPSLQPAHHLAEELVPDDPRADIPTRKSGHELCSDSVRDYEISIHQCISKFLVFPSHP